MNILVISKLSIPAKDRTLPAWEHLRSLGHRVTVEHPGTIKPGPAEWPDAMIAMGVTIMEEAEEALRRFPGVPLFCYQWDTYSWIWKPGQEGRQQAHHASRGQEYDYVRWGNLLRRAKEVWVPSRCTGLQAERWWGVRHWHVILSSCPWWDAEIRCDRCDGDGRVEMLKHCPKCKGRGSLNLIKNGGYALCTLRHLPDAWDTFFEECCEELKIPHLRTDHNLSRPDYEKAVAECSFLVSHYQEASTGGLTLMEGYRLGKPVLLSDSPWNGASEYFRSRATYFGGNDRQSFKDQLMSLWLNTGEEGERPNPLLYADDQREFIEANYSDEVMVTKMLGRMSNAHG